MESEVGTFQSLDNSSYMMIKKMSAENRKQIELTDSLLKNSALNVIVDKVSLINLSSLCDRSPHANAHHYFLSSRAVQHR